MQIELRHELQLRSRSPRLVESLVVPPSAGIIGSGFRVDG